MVRKGLLTQFTEWNLTKNLGSLLYPRRLIKQLRKMVREQGDLFDCLS